MDVHAIIGREQMMECNTLFPEKYRHLAQILRIGDPTVHGAAAVLSRIALDCFAERLWKAVLVCLRGRSTRKKSLLREM